MLYRTYSIVVKLISHSYLKSREGALESRFHSSHWQYPHSSVDVIGLVFHPDISRRFGQQESWEFVDRRWIGILRVQWRTELENYELFSYGKEETYMKSV